MTAIRPRYNRCDNCGRNAHKVAVRTPRGVHGYCPSCFAEKVERKVGSGYGFPADAAVIYDRRSDRTKMNAAQRAKVAAIREHVGTVESIVGTTRGDVAVVSTDAAGNPRRHRVTPEGVAVPVYAA